MRISQQLTWTLREVPRDVECRSQEFLLRAGFIRQLTTGVYSFLPLGQRVMHKLAQIIRESMDAAAGQEISLPMLQPRDLWEACIEEQVSRAATLGDLLFSLRDRRGRELVLAPTHEEAVTLLAAEFVRSYRDLPQRLYQLQTKWRDEVRPRAGLLRTREFIMLDLYSFDADQEGLTASYQQLILAYRRIFEHIGLRYLMVDADSGAIGGKVSHEFLAPTEAGEDDALVCDTCGYAANREKAVFLCPELAVEEAQAELEEIYTPGCAAISDLTALLQVPKARTLKAVCYSISGRLLMALVRGDLDIQEVKLAQAVRRLGLSAHNLRLATPEELSAAGIVAGFTSPLGKGADIILLADLSVQNARNMVAGANRIDYHLKNVNYPRDFRVDAWDDLAAARAGDACAHCQGSLREVRGTEIGHIFQVGAYYSTLFNATFLDAAGQTRPLLMGCYGIGLGRLLAALIEQHHDERGMIWPMSVAPYHVQLLGLDLDRAETCEQAEQLYSNLLKAGVEVLYDDRPESAGVKFNDADLLGLPLRVVISKRSLKQGGVELKYRQESASRIISLAEAVQVIKDEVSQHLAFVPS